jgi:hypothetical protein
MFETSIRDDVPGSHEKILLSKWGETIGTPQHPSDYKKLHGREFWDTSTGGRTLALITEFKPSAAERNSVHKPVSCGWRTFQVGNSRFLQPDTYGSQDREIPDKVSQSIQLDLHAAAKMMSLIRNAVPDL